MGNHNNSAIATAAHLRATVLSARFQVSSSYAALLGRRCVEELADALCSIEGRDKTASALYQVADAIVGSMPLAGIWPDVPAVPPLADPVEVKAAPSPAPTHPSPKDKRVYWYLLAAFWTGWLLKAVMR